uniref:Protein NO VEIN C-terminal domain-containing protein n=1 Tax=Haptolina ericina TaxID=156174 RepID=A0A7S3AWG5_9EUKA
MLLLPRLHEVDRANVGRWGERLCYEHLQHSQPDSHVVWVNEHSESGLPYDITITVREGSGQHEMQDDSVVRDSVTYVEVKTSVALDKPFFEVSMRELEFAQRSGSAYHLYRVTGAGTAGLSVACLRNPVRCVSSGSGSIVLVLQRAQG